MTAKRINVTHSQIVDAEAARVVDEVEAARRAIHQKTSEPKQVIEDLLAKADIAVAGKVVGRLAADRDPYAHELLRTLSALTPPATSSPSPPTRGGRPTPPPAAPDARPSFRASGGRPNPNTGRQRR